MKPPAIIQKRIDNNVTNGEQSELKNITQGQNITKSKSMKRKLEDDDENKQINKFIKISPNITHQGQSKSNYKENLKRKQINPAIKTVNQKLTKQRTGQPV